MYLPFDQAPLWQLFIFSVFNIGFYLFLRLRLVRLDHRFGNITLDARNCSTVFFCLICVYFCDFYSDGIPDLHTAGIIRL